MDNSRISRRGFIAASTAVAGAAAMPVAAIDFSPVLHGDGIQDDTDALEALLSGKAVRSRREDITAAVDDGTVRLLNGNFRIRRPLKMAADINLYAANCGFSIDGGPISPYPILRIV